MMIETKTNTLINARNFFTYLLLVGLFAFGLLWTTASPIHGASEATVSATVTIQNVQVSVSDGAVSYGTQATGAVVDTTTGGVNDSQTATNDGNVTEDFNIKGQNTVSWTLASTAGADQYFHKFCTASCDSSPTWTASSATYQTLATGVTSGSSQVFDLQLGAPTSTTDFTQQNTDVTVQAVAQ